MSLCLRADRDHSRAQRRVQVVPDLQVAASGSIVWELQEFALVHGRTVSLYLLDPATAQCDPT